MAAARLKKGQQKAAKDTKGNEMEQQIKNTGPDSVLDITARAQEHSHKSPSENTVPVANG